MKDKILLGQVVGNSFTDDFETFDISEVKVVLKSLSLEDAIDIAHAEMLQLKSLYAADLLIEHIAKLVKIVSYLESKINSVKSKVSLQYKEKDGKTTAEMKKQAGESNPEVLELGERLAKAKGAKVFLEKKYDILIKLHHYYKDITNSQKKGMVSTTSSTIGWE